jgi:hypothetical protein
VNVNDWIPVLNTTEETIPSFGVMSVLGDLDDDGAVSVGKPDENGSARFLVNGEVAIRPGKGGKGTPGLRCVVAYDEEDGTPAIGEDWGPGVDTWKLKKGNTGFFLWGAAGGVANGLRLWASPPAACERLAVTGQLSGDGAWHDMVLSGGGRLAGVSGVVGPSGRYADVEVQVVEAVSLAVLSSKFPFRIYSSWDQINTAWFFPFYRGVFSGQFLYTATGPTTLKMRHQTTLSNATIDTGSSDVSGRIGYVEVAAPPVGGCVGT